MSERNIALPRINLRQTVSRGGRLLDGTKTHKSKPSRSISLADQLQPVQSAESLEFLQYLEFRHVGGDVAHVETSGGLLGGEKRGVVVFLCYIVLGGGRLREGGATGGAAGDQ